MSDASRLLRSNLKFKHLQLLVKLDEHRHLGKAAEAMHTAQPAVSKALGELEAMVSARLFERSSRGTEPTAEGYALIHFAREALAQLGRVSAELDAIGSGNAGSVHVGTTMGASAQLIPSIVLRLKQESPTTCVRIDEGPLESLSPRLSLGQLDLIVGSLDAVHSSHELQTEMLYMGGSVVVASPLHPLAGTPDKASWPGLHRFAWVLPPLGSTARSRFEMNRVHYRMDRPADFVETDSFLCLFRLVREREALAVMAVSVARHFESLGLLKILPLPIASPRSRIGILRGKNRRHNPAAELFCRFAREAVAELS
jgi:DNA-binding transcriptional LysR family regulator